MEAVEALTARLRDYPQSTVADLCDWSMLDARTVALALMVINDNGGEQQ